MGHPTLHFNVKAFLAFDSFAITSTLNWGVGSQGVFLTVLSVIVALFGASVVVLVML